MQDPQPISIDEERLVPVWSMILAVASALAIEYYMWLVLPGQVHHQAPMGIRIYLNLSWGVLTAIYFLMVGYVSIDAPRRSMSIRFWVILCLVMPAGIGAVLYFLLRSPLLVRCPACTTMVQSDFHFCPQCRYQLMASCGNCFRTVRGSDQYCAHCGHELLQDQTPARLKLV
jgi:hypothetical protein